MKMVYVAKKISVAQTMETTIPLVIVAPIMIPSHKKALKLQSGIVMIQMVYCGAHFKISRSLVSI
jgi:hypothetical protein